MKGLLRRLFLHAGFQILLCALLVTGSEVFLKIGAQQTAGVPTHLEWFGYTGLLSGWVWLGIILIVASLLSWLYVLRTVPLNLAFALSNVSHVFVPLSCWWILHETISPLRWTGIALVLAGLVIAARQFTRIEQRL